MQASGLHNSQREPHLADPRSLEDQGIVGETDVGLAAAYMALSLQVSQCRALNRNSRVRQSSGEDPHLTLGQEWSL